MFWDPGNPYLWVWIFQITLETPRKLQRTYWALSKNTDSHPCTRPPNEHEWREVYPCKSYRTIHSGYGTTPVWCRGGSWYVQGCWEFPYLKIKMSSKLPCVCFIVFPVAMMNFLFLFSFYNFNSVYAQFSFSTSFLLKNVGTMGFNTCENLGCPYLQH